MKFWPRRHKHVYCLANSVGEAKKKKLRNKAQDVDKVHIFVGKERKGRQSANMFVNSTHYTAHVALSLFVLSATERDVARLLDAPCLRSRALDSSQARPWERSNATFCICVLGTSYASMGLYIRHLLPNSHSLHTKRSWRKMAVIQAPSVVHSFRFLYCV